MLFFDNPVNEIKSWIYYIHNMANILMIILSADLSKTKYLNDKGGLWQYFWLFSESILSNFDNWEKVFSASSAAIYKYLLEYCIQAASG